MNIIPRRIARLPLIAATAVLLVGGCASSSETADMSDADSARTDHRVLRHVVMFKFKDDAPDQQVEKIVDAFRALPEKIDTIRDFEYGTNVSPEGKAHGYTHTFLVTFDDAAGRDAYLPHPAHQRFVELLKPALDKALVFDYFAER